MTVGTTVLIVTAPMAFAVTVLCLVMAVAIIREHF